MHEPTHLDLFSGIGGFALAAQRAGFRTVAFVENNAYCQRVLAKNFKADIVADADAGRREIEREPQHSNEQGAPRAESHGRGAWRWRERPLIYSDIFDFDGTAYRGVDVVTGGFPCQPFSHAGLQRGAADDRAIWPEMFRVISEARPAWVLGENVPGLIPMELDNVLSDLEGIGYATRAFVIPACAVDARHRRDRVWIVGRDVIYANGDGQSIMPVDEQMAKLQSCDPAYANQQGLEGQRQIACGTGTQFNDIGDYCRWLPEPDVGRVAVRLPEELDCYRYEPEWEGVPRVATGVKDRVNRLRALGNSIQSQVAYEILREIRKLI